MKRGSTDDPFAEDPESQESKPEPESEPEPAPGSELEPEAESDAAPDRSGPRFSPDDTVTPDPDPDSGPSDIPYIYLRDAVKEGRNQRPVYLREYNERRISDLVDAVEADLGEEVTKTDVLEAAMETAIENPALVASTLRTDRYGYDWQ